ncbi:DUF7490 domain-containing protein [Haladaptatus sp. DFWS20]|uniref:DUF7490 domain-containing protein n=1 Tax=Haladaptatus sp. DFWS20 TaxID=3403467 RepID=UPI003EBF32CF
MNRERILAGGIAILVMASLLAIVLIPGAIAETASDDVRASHLQIEDVSIEPGSISGGTATLAVETRLDHRGGPAENVTVLVRAIHADSGFVETTTEQQVPTIEGQREASVTQNISVERRGDYRIKTVVFRDGERIAEGTKEVSGVGALKAGYAETNIAFHWQDGTSDFPPVEYSIADAENNRTTLNVSTYLTNQGDDPSENVRVVFTARQADSNIVANRVSVPVGKIDAGRTASPVASLSVPDGYNYYLDAVLWKDAVVVGSARSAANLDPSETLSVNETNQEVKLSVSDFSDDNAPKSKDRTTTANDGGQPGFTVPAGITALLVGGVQLPGGNMTETESNSMTQPNDEPTTKPTGRKNVQEYLYRGALVLLVFLAIIALFQFYMSVLAVIRTFVADQYRPLFNAAFNLAVLLATGIGISYVVRKID